MVSTQSLKDLALLTLRTPKEAADQIISMSFSRDVLWSAVAVVAIINTILSSLSNMILPVPEPLAGIVANPFMFFFVIAGSMVLTVHALYWTGRMMGGQGDLGGLLSLIVWLQILRTVAQFTILVTVLVAPFIASFLVLIVSAATLWIFLNFVSVGLQLNSLARAFVVIVVGGIALILGLSFFLSLIGVTAMGVPNV
jgi:hypothetical protein